MHPDLLKDLELSVSVPLGLGQSWQAQDVRPESSSSWLLGEVGWLGLLRSLWTSDDRFCPSGVLYNILRDAETMNELKSAACAQSPSSQTKNPNPETGVHDTIIVQ